MRDSRGDERSRQAQPGADRADQIQAKVLDAGASTDNHQLGLARLFARVTTAAEALRRPLLGV